MITGLLFIGQILLWLVIDRLFTGVMSSRLDYRLLDMLALLAISFAATETFPFSRVALTVVGLGLLATVRLLTLRERHDPILTNGEVAAKKTKGRSSKNDH